MWPWSRKGPAGAGPAWWEAIHCTCSGEPQRHRLALINSDGGEIAAYEMPADAAHQIAKRIDDRKFGVSCGEFVVSPTFEFAIAPGEVARVDVRYIALVELTTAIRAARTSGEASRG